MRILFKLLAVVVLASASISYFKYFREVQSSSPDHQQYVVVDEVTWRNARPDLADLRLYAGQNEVPYALSIERGSSETEQKEVRILQPASVAGKTQFFLDMAGLAEYDRIDLTVKTRNFVAKVRVDGQDDLHGSHWATLSNGIVYDLSEDGLGGNTTLRLPVTAYKYLRVTIDGPVKPSDVENAWARIREEEKEAWRTVAQQPKREEQGKDTVFTFAAPRNAPVERLEFFIDPGQPNFRREVELESDRKRQLGSGEISRVHMVRHGQKIDFEQDYVDLGGSYPEVLKAIVHNGDDPPLKITGVRLRQYQRRIYFNSSSSPRLYYGDEKLASSPIYDYAKLFQKDAKATEVQLGAEQSNNEFTGRPDERPWSEKHPAVLWVAIIAAVLILGAMALRSMKAVATQKTS
ncbi:MAG TPA: DUF3999 family protein [Candidatus Angelobacter sp.]